MFYFFCINVSFIKVDENNWDIISNDKSNNECYSVCIFFEVIKIIEVFLRIMVIVDS